MQQTEFLDKIRFRLSNIAVGASALRNQGAPGIVNKSRSYFFNINLDEFFTSLPNSNDYENFLETHTEKLKNEFAIGNSGWGAARKGLNLYFREVVYNRFLSEFYQLPTEFHEYNLAIKNLEVPLDKDVGENLVKANASLPKWNRIKNLDKEISDAYQQAALAIAVSANIARVHLDLIYWRSNLSTNR